MTTDESNNGMESKLQESVFLSERRLPNEEYFSDPLVFKNKKKRVSQSKIHQGRLENLSMKLS
jgi:ATP sulfurylase